MLEKKHMVPKGEEHTVKYRSIFLGSDNMCRNLEEEGLFVETFLVLVWFREVDSTQARRLTFAVGSLFLWHLKEVKFIELSAV